MIGSELQCALIDSSMKKQLPRIRGDCPALCVKLAMPAARTSAAPGDLGFLQEYFRNGIWPVGSPGLKASPWTPSADASVSCLLSPRAVHRVLWLLTTHTSVLPEGTCAMVCAPTSAFAWSLPKVLFVFHRNTIFEVI